MRLADLRWVREMAQRQKCFVKDAEGLKYSVWWFQEPIEIVGSPYGVWCLTPTVGLGVYFKNDLELSCWLADKEPF